MGSSGQQVKLRCIYMYRYLAVEIYHNIVKWWQLTVCNVPSGCAEFSYYTMSLLPSLVPRSLGMRLPLL